MMAIKDQEWMDVCYTLKPDEGMEWAQQLPKIVKKL